MLYFAAALLLLVYGSEALSYAVETPWDFVSLARSRREAGAGGPALDSLPVSSTLIPFAERDLQQAINETLEWTQLSKESEIQIQEVDYIYYTIRYHAPNEDNFNRFWLDSETLAKRYPNNSKIDHPQLASSYRRAVSLITSFDFPFYGHPLRNVTIATGGFCYVGDQMHSWLAATQYVAPLMSNFDTTPKGATIIYADTGKLMVVEWRDVVLRNQPDAGNFTFQVSLHANGSIWFAYKKVAINVSDISDTHHPRKIGLSDAYLYEHKVHLDSSLPLNPIGKRVIYEYHRVEINESRIATHAVVEIRPNPVCMALKSCEDCMNASLEHFNCSWCSSKDSGEPFCSDQDGLNRRRQDWNRGSCRHQTSMTYCTDLLASTQPSSPSTTSATSPLPLTRRPVPGAKDPSAVPNPPPSSDHEQEEAVSGGGVSVAGLLLLLAVVLLVGGWVAYAYFNPHTPSGQFLIKYRPGKWRWPGSHGDVRYTASVHM